MPHEFRLDVESLVAIDMHVHIEVDDQSHNALPSALVDAASKYFKTSGPRPGLDEIADMYRERNMAAVVFTVDASSHLRHPPNSSRNNLAHDDADQGRPLEISIPRVRQAYSSRC